MIDIVKTECEHEELWRKVDGYEYEVSSHGRVRNMRTGKLVCQYPREEVTQYLIPYDKSTGLEYGFNSALGTLTAYKAHITLLENEREEYIAKQRGMLFFDASTDQHLLPVDAPLLVNEGTPALEFVAQLTESGQQ